MQRGSHFPQEREAILTISLRHISTPFNYFPRTRPMVPIPLPMQYRAGAGFLATSDWKLYESTLYSKSQTRPNISAKLYIPSSRIFCMTQPIPFHLTLESSAVSLAVFLPFGPTAANPTARKVTRIQLMRQTTVDVRYAHLRLIYPCGR